MYLHIRTPLQVHDLPSALSPQFELCQDDERQLRGLGRGLVTSQWGQWDTQAAAGSREWMALGVAGIITNIVILDHSLIPDLKHH